MIMRTFFRTVLFALAVNFAACDRGPTAPGPGSRSENKNATDARTEDGSNAAGQTTPGNRGGTPGGAAPGGSPNSP